jgi:hypothetical protein
MNPEQPFQNEQPTVPQTGNQPLPPQQPVYAPQPQAQQTAAPQPNQMSGYITTSPPEHPSQPSNGNNPYEFIFTEKQQPKQSTFGGTSTAKRILVIVGGLVVLAIIAAIAFTLLTPKDNSLEKLTSILQEQQEIVRVAGLSDASATNIDLKNLAVNVSLSVGSNATSMQKYLSDRKIKITDTLLLGKQDTKTDTLFASAKSTNTFDHTAAQTLQSLLVTYRSDLNTTYQDVKGTNARKELQSSYQTAEALIVEANKVVGE